MRIENVRRLLVLAAHPDDEIIGCGILLQRVPSALVAFAVDGAPTGYGIERKYGNLTNYSDERFREASRALGLARNCSFQRLKAPDGSYFPDRHLFKRLNEAADSFLAIAQEFSPDAIVSHSYEGGHIDHDACSLLAKYVVRVLSLKHFEFPLYWKGKHGRDVFQEFRDAQDNEILLNPSEAEIAIKARMLAEYWTQRDLVATFSPKIEKLRPVRSSDYAKPPWNSAYPGDWRNLLRTRAAQQRFSEFRKRLARLTDGSRRLSD